MPKAIEFRAFRERQKLYRTHVNILCWPSTRPTESRNFPQIYNIQKVRWLFSQGFQKIIFKIVCIFLKMNNKKLQKISCFFLAIMNFRVTLQPFSQNQKVNQSIKHAYLFRKNTPIFQKIRSCKIGANRK